MWTKQQIRDARKTELVPILLERSYRLYPLKNDNYRILPDPDAPDAPAGVIVKEGFWIWHEKNIYGNTIDFFVKIEGLSFNQAMQIVLVPRPAGTQARSNAQGMPAVVVSHAHDYDRDGNKTRQERGNDSETTP